MKIFNFLKKKKIIEIKQSDPRSGLFRELSIVDSLFGMGKYDLAASVALYYYEHCAPLFTVIDWIANEVCSIKPLLWNSDEKKFIDEHPLLELLKYPGTDTIYEEFLHRLVTFYLLTGNAYIIADGKINTAPLSLHIIPSQTLTFTRGNDGYAQNFHISSVYGVHDFSRKMIKQRFRFYENDIRELHQIKNFNPNAVDMNIVGISSLTPIFYEIEQYISASKHNLSLLKRGATVGGIFITQQKLTDDSYQRLRAQINEYYTGHNNAGRAFIAEGVDFKPSGQSMKDMDFVQLKKDVTAAIYKAFRIPAPLVSEDTMTMANMEISKLSFYDNVILPLTKRIYSELSNFLIPRYDNRENLSLAYDERSILALAPRHNQNLEILKNLGVLTTNNLRTLIGYDPVEGGDDLYQPAANVPYAHEKEIDDIEETEDSE